MSEKSSHCVIGYVYSLPGFWVYERFVNPYEVLVTGVIGNLVYYQFLEDIDKGYPFSFPMNTAVWNENKDKRQPSRQYDKPFKCITQPISY